DDRRARQAAAGIREAGLGAVAVRRVHRLGPGIPQDSRSGATGRALGDVPLPVVGVGEPPRPPREAGHRPEGPGPLPGRAEPHALPRAIRPRGRSGLDLAPDRIAGTSPRDPGPTRGTGPE